VHLFRRGSKGAPLEAVRHHAEPADRFENDGVRGMGKPRRRNLVGSLYTSTPLQPAAKKINVNSVDKVEQVEGTGTPSAMLPSLAPLRLNPKVDYGALPGRDELYDPWMTNVLSWCILVQRRPLRPTLKELQSTHKVLLAMEQTTIHTLEQSKIHFDFALRVGSCRHRDLKEGAEWLINKIVEHQKLRNTALMFCNWAAIGQATVEQAEVQLNASIPWPEIVALQNRGWRTGPGDFSGIQ
jgi:hypothetical protein